MFLTRWSETLIRKIPRMIVTRRLFLLMLLLPGGIFIETSPAAAAPPRIAGQWYGTWEIPEFTWTSNFSIYFRDDPEFGLLVRIYAPEFDLFDQWLPATLVEDAAGALLTIKLTIRG